MGITAGIIGGGALSGLGQIFGSQSAAKAQTSAANAATQAQLAMFGVTRASLAPFIKSGTAAYNELFGTPRTAATPSVWVGPNGQTKSLAYNAPSPGAGWTLKTKGQAPVAARPGAIQDLIKPINIDQAALEQTPGYQWTLGQGEKSVENSLTARGLGQSGAVIKGAEQYATGLASQTYQQQFQNALTNKQNEYNMLFGGAQLGESAAAGQAGAATAVGGQIGSNIIGAGNAQAGADIAGANAATGISNSLVNALLVQQSLGRSSATGGLY